MKKQNSFFRAGAVLVLSNIVVKALSAAYRIPLTRMLGADTMGRYSAVYNLFMPFFSFATAGITTTVAHYTAASASPLVASVRKNAFGLYLPLSVVFGALFLAFAKGYAQWHNDSLFFTGAVILAPAILLSAVENIFKGITQGQMNMLPTATANLTEGLFKTTAGLGCVWLVINHWHGNDDTALVVCFATVTLSAAVCTAMLLFSCGERRGEKSAPAPSTITVRQMFAMSLPVGVSALTISLSSFFETAVCLPVIAKIPYQQIVASFRGASFMGAGDMSMYLYGIWQGMVLTVFNLTPVVLSAVGTAALPLVSKSYALNDKKQLEHYTQKLFSVTAAFGVPAMCMVFCFGGQIVQLLFGTTAQQAVVALQLLRIVCCGGVFCCFGSAFNSVLYAAGRSDKAFYILLVASVARMSTGFLLCRVPWLNIKALAVSTVVFHTIIFTGSILAVRKLGIQFDLWGIFALPLMASLVSVLLSNWLVTAQLVSLPLFLQLFFAGVVAGLVYLLILICTGFFVDK